MLLPVPIGRFSTSVMLHSAREKTTATQQQVFSVGSGLTVRIGKEEPRKRGGRHDGLPRGYAYRIAHCHTQHSMTTMRSSCRSKVVPACMHTVGRSSNDSLGVTDSAQFALCPTASPSVPCRGEFEKAAASHRNQPFSRTSLCSASNRTESG